MKRILTAVLILACTAANAQDTSDMETDRPDQTETPVLVARRYVQAEAGVMRENQGDRNYVINAPTILLKYGLSNRVELRLQADYLWQYEHLIPNPVTTGGVAPIEIGTKVALFKENGPRPQASFIGHIGITALASDAFRPAEPVASLRLAFQNTLSKVTQLGYNIGLEWTGESSSPKFAYTFAPGCNLSDRLYFFVECYGFIGKENDQDHNFDAGFAYAVSRNVKVDLSGGHGLSKASSPGFVSFGFAFRVPTGKP